MQVSSSVYGLIKLAVETSRENFGFNALIGPLVKLWSIGFQDARVPSDAEIQEKMKLIDPWMVELNDDDHTVFLKQEGMELDLGGIAKGWTADRIRDSGGPTGSKPASSTWAAMSSSSTLARSGPTGCGR